MLMITRYNFLLYSEVFVYLRKGHIYNQGEKTRLKKEIFQNVLCNPPATSSSGWFQEMKPVTSLILKTSKVLRHLWLRDRDGLTPQQVQTWDICPIARRHEEESQLFRDSSMLPCNRRRACQTSLAFGCKPGMTMQWIECSVTSILRKVHFSSEF